MPATVKFDGSFAPINSIGCCRTSLAHAKHRLIIEWKYDVSIILERQHLNHRAIFPLNYDPQRIRLNFDHQICQLRFGGRIDFTQGQCRGRVIPLRQYRSFWKFWLETLWFQRDPDTFGARNPDIQHSRLAGCCDGPSTKRNRRGGESQEN